MVHVKSLKTSVLWCFMLFCIEANEFKACRSNGNSYFPGPIRSHAHSIVYGIVQVLACPGGGTRSERHLCTVSGHYEYQDQTTQRPNTLLDEADDIQRQLDNEARDRFKFGRPKTIWVFNIPTHFPVIHITEGVRLPRKINLLRVPKAHHRETCPVHPIAPRPKEWDFHDQDKWPQSYPDCGGRSQSPVDLPVDGLIRARGARKLLFRNYDIPPANMVLENNGKTVTLYGEWPQKKRPLVHGGAAHSRRYLFHSLTLYWPTEHLVGGLQYPLESQLLHISADYGSFEEAVAASASDSQAFLGIVNIYKYSETTHEGLEVLLQKVLNGGLVNQTVKPVALSFFNPPFVDYASYQGSLTTPPCTESVLWLIRARTLPVRRNVVEAVHKLLGCEGEPKVFLIRLPQPMNDRKNYLFKKKSQAKATKCLLCDASDNILN